MPANPYVSARSSAATSDPLLGFLFRLDLGGKAAGYFTECSGLGSEHEVSESKVVGPDGKEMVMKQPGRLKWGDLTLKRGVTGDLKLWDWRDKIVQGKVKDARINASVILCNRQYEPVAQWDLINAWPSKITGPSLKADGNEIAVEEIVIVHEGLSRAK
jgi:phage tail-like protein